MRSDSLVHVNNLSIKRGQFVLDVKRFEVPAGQVIGLVGPNGAGKTTLLEAMAGLRPVTSGRISVFGRDPWQEPTVRCDLGFMADDMPVFDMRTGPLLRMISGYYPTWDNALADALIDRFKIDPGKRTDKLSKGQGVRLRLVLAMAFKPRVLLLDEPASGLDLSGRRALLETVLEIVRNPGRSVIISSHMLSDVERIADRLLVLNDGKVIRDGSTEQLVGDERTLEEALRVWGAAG